MVDSFSLSDVQNALNSFKAKAEEVIAAAETKIKNVVDPAATKAHQEAVAAVHEVTTAFNSVLDVIKSKL